MTKRIFVFSTIFALLLVGIAFIGYQFLGGQGEIAPDDIATYNNEDPTTYPEPTPSPQEEEPEPDNEPEISQDPPMYDPPAEDDPFLDYQGDTSSPWHPIHFRDIRAPHHLDADTPHGYISVRHIQHMNDHYYSRFPFSYQEKRAAAWIVGELLAMGYNWDDIEVQEFDIYDMGRDSTFLNWMHNIAVYHDYDYMRYTYTSQNVILTVPGQSDQILVVGAHYDTVLYPGASDNASGTALLLESAQRMLNIDNYYTIIYIFFGAEEVGLLGAHYFVDTLPDEIFDRIVFMVNADVLFEGPYFIFGGGYQPPGTGRVARANDITRQWESIAEELNNSHDLALINYPPAIFLSSDQRVFLEAGLTVMMLFGADFDAQGGHHFWVLHSYRDCFHYIMERWPYKIEDSMRTFSIFLEEVLLARY